MKMDLSKKEDYPNFDLWLEHGFYSKKLGAKVAPEDLWVWEYGVKKEYWTPDEIAAFESVVLLPNGWRLLTDDEWHLLIEEFGTENGETSHKHLMNNLGLIYGGYVQEENVDNYNNNPHDPSFIHNLGSTGCYASCCGPDGARSDGSMFNRYFYFLKDRDKLYGYEYIGTCGTSIREAYRVRCVAIT